MKLTPMLALGLALATPATISAQTWFHSDSERHALAFGSALIVDGDRIIASRTSISIMFPEPPLTPGGVHVFERGAGGWSIVDSFDQPDGMPGDGFGYDMALGGDWLAVAAPFRDDARGAIYMFRRGPDGWTEAGSLRTAEPAAGDSLGWSLDMDGDVLVAGAPGGEDGDGSAYVWRLIDGTWIQNARFSATAPATGFGRAVAVAGNTVMIGAPLQGADSSSNGSVTVYVTDGGAGTWALSQTVTGTVPRFGTAIAMDGDAALIGATGARNVGGSVDYYTRAGGTWSAGGSLSPADAANPTATGYGAGLALSGNEAWVGSPLQGNSGAVFVFSMAGGSWSESAVLSDDDVSRGGRFGDRVAFAGDLGITSARRSDFGQGRAVVYTRSMGSWTAETTLFNPALEMTAVNGETIRCEDGSAAIFDCADIELLAFMPRAEIGAEGGVTMADIWGWTDPDTGREYALQARSNGTSFIDVTNPNAPVYLGDLPLTATATPNAWRDVKVYANHAFVVADGVGQHGMQVFDLTRLRDVQSPPVTFDADALYEDVASVHNVVINEQTGFAFLVGGGQGGVVCGGMHMVDIRNPKEPTFAGCFANPAEGPGSGGTHDAQCVIYHGPDVAYTGRELCFNSNGSGLLIADVTDKSNPVQVAIAAYPSVAYAHQGWLTDDQRYFYLNDEGDEMSGDLQGTRTMIFDVGEIEDPVMVAEYFGETEASDHNLYIRGDLMYESNYVAGLRIIDISDRENPVEVGHFDTVPWGENTPGFTGSWSNYPFFESGTIIVSSIREGLFLLRKREALVP